MEMYAFHRRQLGWVRSAILLPTVLLALQGRADAQAYRFRTFGIDEGLGNLAVTCLTQDAAGYLWTGTLNGVYRYDGERFQRFARAEGLPDSEVVSLAAGAHGKLWAATTSGVSVFRDGHFHRVLFGRAVSLIGPSSLAIEKPTGAIWIATSAGVAVVTLREADRPSPRARFIEGLPQADYAGVAFASDGLPWLVGSRKVYRFQSGTASLMGKDAGVPDEDWQALVADASGTIWIRSAAKLVALASGARRFADRTAGLPGAEFASLGLDSNGRIAVPTVHGLARWLNDSWQLVGSRSGLTMDSVSSVFFDREGSPWIGTNGGGVAQWLGYGAWENWTAPAWVDNDATWSFTEDKLGQVWAGTNNGIVSLPLDPGARAKRLVTWFHLKSDVRALAMGTQGNIWAGTGREGVFRCSVRTRACRQFGRPAGLPAKAINALLVDAKDNLWVASDTGLFVAHIKPAGMMFREAIPISANKEKVVRQLAQAGDGEIVAACKSGLFRGDGKTWTRLTAADGLLDDDLGQVATDAPGSFWISYERDLGVSHLQDLVGGRRKWEHFDQNGALGSNYVYSLGLDNRRHVWVGTDRGIDSWNGFIWRHLGTEDGLIWPDLNTAGFFSSRRGGLWFGTSRGIAHLVAPASSERQVLPVPIVSQAQVNGRDQDLNKPIVLPFLNNEITLHFSTLSFAEEGRVRYKYRIEGLQDEWRYSRDRNVHLLHLPPGTYHFTLAALLPGAGRSAKLTQLQFSVETPWWRTRLFTAASVILLLGAVRGIWLWKMRAALRRQRLLETAVTERTAALTIEQGRLMQAQQAFVYQATHDALTKLANRSLLNQFLEDVVAGDQSASILWIDLDRFKAVNDLYGHHMGDRLLQATAGRLTGILRSGDIAARIGGDEFVVVLLRCSEAEDCQLADRLLRSLSAPFEIGNQAFVVGASIGIARFPEHGDCPAVLLKSADIAMYNAKKNGKGAYRLFDAELAEEIGRPVEMERQLKGVLQRDELYLVYQPQVDARGIVEAVEVLIRWSSPVLGMVSPAGFIPIAEETGAIVEIGEWVLQTACEQGAAWHRDGSLIRVAVNVSVIQLTRPDFADTVIRILKASKFDPRFLELEITETAVMGNTEECIRQMNRIRAMNIRIAIDDFGTGNSCLSYLHLLPVDTLKIDQSFVSSLESAQNDHSSMIRGIIGLAHGLKLRVIAEGVETENQAGILRAEGCESMQGWLFFRPLRADAVMSALSTNAAGAERVPEPPLLEFTHWPGGAAGVPKFNRAAGQEGPPPNP